MVLEKETKHQTEKPFLKEGAEKEERNSPELNFNQKVI